MWATRGSRRCACSCRQRVFIPRSTVRGPLVGHQRASKPRGRCLPSARPRVTQCAKDRAAARSPPAPPCLAGDDSRPERQTQRNQLRRRRSAIFRSRSLPPASHPPQHGAGPFLPAYQPPANASPLRAVLVGGARRPRATTSSGNQKKDRGLRLPLIKPRARYEITSRF